MLTILLKPYLKHQYSVSLWPLRCSDGQFAGGRVNIHVTSDGLTKENGVFPDLRITLRSQDMHAPLVERMVELPVDITAGACLGCAIFALMCSGHSLLLSSVPDFALVMWWQESGCSGGVLL